MTRPRLVLLLVAAVIGAAFADASAARREGSSGADAERGGRRTIVDYQVGFARTVEGGPNGEELVVQAHVFATWRVGTGWAKAGRGVACDLWEFARAAGQTTASVVCDAPAKAKPVKLRFDVLSYAEHPDESGSFVESDECRERQRGRTAHGRRPGPAAVARVAPTSAAPCLESVGAPWVRACARPPFAETDPGA